MSSDISSDISSDVRVDGQVHDERADLRVAIDVSAVHSTSGGVLRYVDGLVRNLPSLGVELLLVDQRVRAGSVEGRLFSAVGQTTVIGRAPKSPAARLVWEQLALARLVGQLGDVTVLHSPHYTMPRVGARVSGGGSTRRGGRARRVASVVTIHDLTFFTLPHLHAPSKKRFFRSAIRYAATHADALVCVSDRTASLLQQHVDVRVPVVVAPHGIDTSRFQGTSPSNREFDAEILARLGVRLPYVLSVGTIAPHKNIGALLQAFDQVRRRPGMSELTLVVGGNSWPGAWEAVEQWSTPAVNRIGFVADEALPALYRNAAVFVYPSFEEGFGLPVLEALACGAPVVTTAGSVMADVAGAHAVTVDTTSLTAIADGIAQCLEPSFGEAADRIGYAHGFTWENSAVKHRDAYELARQTL